MTRRYLNQIPKSDKAASKINVYREMLNDIAVRPCSGWMDTGHRFYALRRLARSVVAHDRALRMAHACPTARIPCSARKDENDGY